MLDGFSYSLDNCCRQVDFTYVYKLYFLSVGRAALAVRAAFRSQRATLSGIVVFATFSVCMGESHLEIS